MDALTHRLAAAVGTLISLNATQGVSDAAWERAVADADTVWQEYDQRCKEQAGIDHYHGREGG